MKKKSFKHRQLLFKHHNPFKLQPISSIILIQSFGLSTSIRSASILNITRASSQIFLHLQDSSISLLEITWKNQQPVSTLIKTSDNVPLFHDLVFSSSQGKGLILFSASEKLAFITTSNYQLTQNSILAPIPLISYCDCSFLVCPDECTAGYVSDKKSYKKLLVLCKTNNQIRFLVSHPQFRIFAYATTGDEIFVHSLKYGNLLGSMSIGTEIIDLIITHSWGYVVGRTENEIIVLSGDGEFLKRILFPEKILFRQAITSEKGFDFILFQTIEKKFGYFEVFIQKIKS